MSKKQELIEAQMKAAESDSKAMIARAAVLSVVDHAEKLKSLAWEAIDLMRRLINASDVRMAPGVYFLLDTTGTVVYVGKSSNVLLRMAGHKDKSFVAVRMIEVLDDVERGQLEERFIHLLKPSINTSLTAFNHSHALLECDVGELARKHFYIGVL